MLHAVLDGGSSCSVSLVKAGRHVGPKAEDYWPDVAVFHCKSGLPTPLPAAGPSTGDWVFVIGHDDHGQLSCKEGVLSSQGWTTSSITASVDDGYRGSPVFNEYGRFLGLVVAGFKVNGIEINQVRQYRAVGMCV